jgi:ribosome-binding factor A
MLVYETSDPRIIGVTATRVEMSGDLRHAKVYVSISGSEDEARAALEGLRHAAGYYRRELATRLDLRHAPEVTFIRDQAIVGGERLLELFEQVKEEHA